MLWLSLAVAFAVAAWWTFGARGGWVPFAALVTVASLLLCVLRLPESKVGLVTNGVVLFVLHLNARWQWVEA